MKTYDIYAKQNGKWQRKGIQGEPTLPEYDGTVIIEKAESGVVIEWDGDTTNLPSIEDAYYKVTDRVFTTEELEGGLISTKGGTIDSPISITMNEMGLIIFEGEYGGGIVASVEGDIDDFIVPETGTYLLKVNDNYVTKLYLPNAKNTEGVSV